MIMKKYRSRKTASALLFTAFAPAILLTACTTQEAQNNGQTAATQNRLLTATPLPFSAEQAVLTDNQWLSVHPHGHMLLSDNSGGILDQQAVSAEFISQRSDSEGPLFVSMDSQHNRLISYRVRNNKISDIKHGASLPYPVEGLCLYQPSANELNVFILDENQMAHQLLISAAGADLSQREIRQFPLPPASEYCVADDATGQLFVSEENIGVWVYNARAESEVVRAPVDLVQPWGKLKHNAGPLAISNGQLLLAEPGTNLLHSYPIVQQGVTAGMEWQLNQPVAADALTVSTSGQQTILTILDDESGLLYQTEISLPLRTEQPALIAQLAASGETTPVHTNGDAADDPAIWVNRQQPELSRILGTNKKFGLYVYDLQGNELQELKTGRVNNVDVRQGFTYQGKAADIAAASQRDQRAIALFHIDPLNGQVAFAGKIATTLDNVYGLCMYKNNAGEFFVFIDDQDGRVEQYAITDSEQGWQGNKVREFAVASQPEGCAADDAAQRLFIGEEDVAVWTLGAEPADSTEMTQVAPASDILVADIEGMDIYRSADAAYLVVSSQGNDSYVVYNAEAPYSYLGRFRISINSEAGIDGASETDGLAVTSAALGDQYPHGMLVVQDGRNMLPDENQNFKYVDWQDIQKLLNL